VNTDPIIAVSKSGFLRLTLWTDGDGTAELRAEVSSNGFSGQSSAWFSLPTLGGFAEQLLTYPLPPDGLAPLRGGYRSKERPGELADQHVSIRLCPVGLRGAVGCRVELRTHAQQSNVPSHADAVDVELKTSYQELSEFSRNLQRLIRGEVSELH